MDETQMMELFARNRDTVTIKWRVDDVLEPEAIGALGRHAL
jgi:hypothetical protein